MNVQKGDYLISTEKQRLDVALIHRELASSYWAKNIPEEIVRRSIEGSLCFGIYKGEAQVGFARVVSDYATCAYLADVFVIEAGRGKGLSKWLMEVILSHPRLQGLRRFSLATKDAHGLYAQFGFTPLKAPERMMEILKTDLYPA